MSRKPDWRKAEDTRRWQRKALLNRSGGRCENCGDELNLIHGDPKQATRDHIVPRCEGGSDQMSNLQILCRVCNVAKGGDLLPSDDEADAGGNQ